jgi:hypothetical protein
VLILDGLRVIVREKRGRDLKRDTRGRISHEIHIVKNNSTDKPETRRQKLGKGKRDKGKIPTRDTGVWGTRKSNSTDKPETRRQKLEKGKRDKGKIPTRDTGVWGTRAQ